MKKLISLLIIVFAMTFGLSPPALATPDYGTINQFTIDQADLDMDITIDVCIEIIPALDIEMKTELIYLEGTVIIGPGSSLQIIHIDPTVMLSMNRQITHNDMSLLHSYGDKNQEIYSLAETTIQGSPQLGIYELSATWRYQETYS